MRERSSNIISRRNEDNGAGQFAISPPACGAQFRHVAIKIDHPDNVRRESADIRQWGVYQRSGVVICPLHDACLEIIQRVSLNNATCGNSRYGTLEGHYDAMLRLHERNTEWPWDTPLAEELSQYVAYPQEYGSYKLEWEHLNYGAARFADGSSWCIEPGWEVCDFPLSMHHRSPYSDTNIQWICADPLSIPGLTSYVLSHLQPLISGEPSDTTKPRVVGLPPTRTATAFEALPTEIMNAIVSFLPAIPALRLRRCSSTLYAKISLDQKFWLDHLVSGDLVDYLWDLNTQKLHKKHKEGCWDWKQLAQLFSYAEIIESGLAKSLRGEEDCWTTAFEKASMHKTKFRDAPIGLQNRCRIMKVVRDIEEIEKKVEAEKVEVEKVEAEEREIEKTEARNAEAVKAEAKN